MTNFRKFIHPFRFQIGDSWWYGSSKKEYGHIEPWWKPFSHWWRCQLWIHQEKFYSEFTVWLVTPSFISHFETRNDKKVNRNDIIWWWRNEGSWIWKSWSHFGTVHHVKRIRILNLYILFLATVMQKDTNWRHWIMVHDSWSWFMEIFKVQIGYN